jgi:hypothetical protein
MVTIDNRMAVKRKPWMKWYPADWRGEQLLRLVSREARSVWVDLLGLMHESTLIGTLFVNGKIPSVETLAKMFGDDPQKLAGWISELVENGVCSVDEDGALYSRKMRNAAEISEKGREHVQKRGGAWAPGKKPAKPNKKANRDPNRGANRDPTPQRLDTTQEVEELESPLTSSNSEPLYLEDSLLVSPNGEPHPRPAKKLISSKIERGTRWLYDCVPEAWIAEAAAAYPNVDVREEAKAFHNYWISVSGAKGVKLNWHATWMGWIQREAKRLKERSNGRPNGRDQGQPRAAFDVFAEAYLDARAERERLERERLEREAARH